MSIQFIDFTTGGATGDTNDTNQAAVRPATDGEAATAATVNRMPENLRTRTEAIRSAINELKYLSDADRAFVLTGGGTATNPLTWNSTTGVLTAYTNVVLRPFLSPMASTRSSVTLTNAIAPNDAFKLAFNANGPRAYSGGNEYVVEFVTGASFSVVASGTPVRKFTVTYVSGTTVTGLVALLAANATLIANNVAATVTNGGAQTAAPPAGVHRFSGALDAERHEISPAALATFFATVGNRLTADGDTLGVYFPSLYSGTGAGRKESVPDYGNGAGTPNVLVGVSGQLFNLRLNPEYVPYALPLCTRSGDDLVFLNGASISANGTLASLSAGFVQRSGDLMTGQLRFDFGAAFNNSEEGIVNVTVPAGTVDDAYGVLVTVNDSGGGIKVNKGAGQGSAVTVNHGGGDPAIYIYNGGAGTTLSISSVAAGAAEVVSINSNNGAATLKSLNTGSGVALEVRKSTVGAVPANTVAYIEGGVNHTGLRVRSPSTSTVPTFGIDVVAPIGAGIAHAGIKTTSTEGSNAPGGYNSVGLLCLSQGTTPGAAIVAQEWTTSGPVAALLVTGKPGADGTLLHVKNQSATVTGDYSLLLLEVAHLAGNNGVGLWVSTEHDDDEAIRIAGRSSFGVTSNAVAAVTVSQGGTAAALTVTQTGVPATGAIDVTLPLGGNVLRVNAGTRALNLRPEAAVPTGDGVVGTNTRGFWRGDLGSVNGAAVTAGEDYEMAYRGTIAAGQEFGGSWYVDFHGKMHIDVRTAVLASTWSPSNATPLNLADFGIGYRPNQAQFGLCFGFDASGVGRVVAAGIGPDGVLFVSNVSGGTYTGITTISGLHLTYSLDAFGW